MGIAAIGARERGSLGVEKANKRGVSNEEEQLDANEYNRVIDALIEVQAAIGTTDAPEAGSIESRIVTHDDSITDLSDRADAYEAAALPLALLIDDLTEGSDRQVVTVSGYSDVGDGGEGDLEWRASSTETHNGGTVFAVAGVSTGRWHRITSGPVKATSFGGTMTASTINAALVIQNALGGGTVTIPKSAMTITGVGSDRILPLSNTRLVFEPGCTIATGVPGGSSIVIEVTSTTVDKENIRVEGNGCVITCDRSTSASSYGIFVNTQNVNDVCRGLYFCDFTIKNTRDDGICVGGNAGAYGENIIFDRIKCQNAYRNGGSITGGCKYFRAIDCEFTGSNGSTIQSGFDVEMDDQSLGNGFLTAVDIAFVRCKFNSNYGQGLYCQGNTTGESARVTAIDCEAHDNGHSSVVYPLQSRGFVSTLDGFVADHCRAFRNRYTGFHLEVGSSAINCLAQDNGTLTYPAPGFALQYGADATKCTSRWNSGAGFTVSSQARVTEPSILTSCTAHNNLGKGIDFSGAKNSRAISCTVTMNRLDGVRLGSSHHCQLTGNFIAGNGMASEASGDNIIVENAASLNTISGGNMVRMSQTYFKDVAVVDATYTTTTRVKLHASASLNDDDYLGMFLRVSGTTNAGAYGMITAYDGTHQCATVYWSSAANAQEYLTGTAPGVGGTAGALAAACDATSTIEIVGGRMFSGSVKACTNTTNATIQLLSELAPHMDDVFNGGVMTVVSGAGSAGAIKSLRITDYDGATQTATLSGVFSTAPTDASVVEIIGVFRPRYGIKINAGCHLNHYEGNDAYLSGITGNISDSGTNTSTAANRVS